MQLQLVCILALCLHFQVNAKTIFTFKGAESKTDNRYIYVKGVLTLALDKTVAEYGEYELVSRFHGLNVARILRQTEKQKNANFFARVSMTNDIAERFTVIPFPVDRGITGYRVAFINSAKRSMYCSQDSLAFLRIKLSIVQGIGWLDSQILKANGFNVYDITNYEKMFELVSLGRVDAFFRGVNEIKSEWQIRHTQFTELQIEPCIALYYPLPRFFITNKDNKANAKRILTGLKLAYADGSFNRLWQEFFLESIKFIELQKRHIIPLDNPFISELDKDYQQYNYQIDTAQE